MEGLKSKFLKFRFSGMLTVALLFGLMAVILFLERSGIHYNYDNPVIQNLPNDKIVTKQQANATLPKNTVLLWNSTEIESSDAMEEFAVILSDMKVGYDAVDLSKSDFPDLYRYDNAVVLLSDLESMGENVIVFNDWIFQGGRAQFAVTLQKNIYSSVLESAMGITESSWDYALLENIHIADGFMVGGGRSFFVEDGYDSAWAVQLDAKKTKVYAWIDNANKAPLVWESSHGRGKIVVVNIGLNEKVLRGFYAAAYSLLDDVSVYPVINASVFYLDDFPSQIPEGYNEYITRDYETSVRDFYVNIWWPSMMNFTDRYGIKYTGLAISCYDDEVDGSTPSQADEGTFLYFGNMLLRQGGELGYHGYNHQPLCMDECDYRDLYDYKTWESEDAMKGAFDSLIALCKKLFPDVSMSVYVPPSNIMSKVGENFLLENYPNIKTISGIYFPDGDFEFGCMQEYEVLPDGRVYQPRIISGCDLTPFMELALVSELNMHYINNHFTHPDDALDPERGAELGWPKLTEYFDEYLNYLYTSAPSLRNLTGSEASSAVQRYVALNVTQERVENRLILHIGNFYDEGYFFVRFNEGEYQSVEGGSLTHMTGNLYLLKAEKETVTIHFK